MCCLKSHQVDTLHDHLQIDVLEWEVILGAVCEDGHYQLLVSDLQSIEVIQLYLQLSL